MSNKDVVILDGDVVRRFVSDDLSYSLTDRRLNNERTARIAMMLAFMGKTVIISTVRADFSYEFIKNSGFTGFLQLIKVERLKNGIEKDS